jgi:hypothetical protein
MQPSVSRALLMVTLILTPAILLIGWFVLEFLAGLPSVLPAD